LELTLGKDATSRWLHLPFLAAPAHALASHVNRLQKCLGEVISSDIPGITNLNRLFIFNLKSLYI